MTATAILPQLYFLTPSPLCSLCLCHSLRSLENHTSLLPGLSASTLRPLQSSLQIAAGVVFLKRQSNSVLSLQWLSMALGTNARL